MLQRKMPSSQQLEDEEKMKNLYNHLGRVVSKASELSNKV